MSTYNSVIFTYNSVLSNAIYKLLSNQVQKPIVTLHISNTANYTLIHTMRYFTINNFVTSITPKYVILSSLGYLEVSLSK